MDNLFNENLFIKNFDQSFYLLNEQNYFDLNNNFNLNTQGDKNLFLKQDNHPFNNRLNLDIKNQFFNQPILNTQNNESIDFENQIFNLKNSRSNDQIDKNIDYDLNILNHLTNNQSIETNYKINPINQIDNRYLNSNYNQINNIIDDQTNNLNDEFKDLNFESLSNFFYTQNNNDNLLDDYLINYEFDSNDKNIFNELNEFTNYHFKNNNHEFNIENGSIVNENDQINFLNNENENNYNLINSNIQIDSINLIESLKDKSNFNINTENYQIDNQEEDLNFKKSKNELNHKLDDYIKSEFKDITENFELNYDLDKKYYCNDCNQTFYLVIELNEHFCSVKNYSITNKSNLDKSISLNDKKSNLVRLKKTILKCELCLYSTADRSKLKRHYITHSREKTFRCEYCGYTFTQSASLKKHTIDVHLKDNQKFKYIKFNDNQETKNRLNEIIYDLNQSNIKTEKNLDNVQLGKENAQQINYKIDEQLTDQNNLINMDQNLDNQINNLGNQFINNQINGNQFINNQANINNQFVDNQMNILNSQLIDNKMIINQLYSINNNINYDLPFNDYQINYQLNYDNSNYEQNTIDDFIYFNCANQQNDENFTNSNLIIENKIDRNNQEFDYDNYSKLFDFMY